MYKIDKLPKIGCQFKKCIYIIKNTIETQVNNINDYKNQQASKVQVQLRVRNTGAKRNYDSVLEQLEHQETESHATGPEPAEKKTWKPGK